ncbi:MAG: cyclic nucleotide-binding domain-containing protein [Actinomycetota bacterium]|nr:cyclic nucleotide-binding domain-containing protein [Actinomycetota bacterium]
MAATDDRPIPDEVAEYLRLHHIITLSTASFTGMPHANTVAYANDDMRIFFLAPESVQIVRNIRDNHYASFTIDDYTTDWRKARELQGVGRCHPATAEERNSSYPHFVEKFGDRVAMFSGIVFSIRPLEMHFVDYRYEVATPSQPAPLPEITSRSFQMADMAGPPNNGAVSTNLNRAIFDPGEVIFRPGESVGHYYVVLEGEVEVRGEGYGADQTITRVTAGQMFGDQAALFGQRGGLTAHAITPTVVLAVQREAIRDIFLPQVG